MNDSASTAIVKTDRRSRSARREMFTVARLSSKKSRRRLRKKKRSRADSEILCLLDYN